MPETSDVEVVLTNSERLLLLKHINSELRSNGSLNMSVVRLENLYSLQSKLKIALKEKSNADI